MLYHMVTSLTWAVTGFSPGSTKATPQGWNHVARDSAGLSLVAWGLGSPLAHLHPAIVGVVAVLSLHFLGPDRASFPGPLCLGAAK